MTMTQLGKAGRCALWFAPIVIVPVAFFSSIPWLKQQHDAIALSIAAAGSIFVMGYSAFLAARMNWRLDEVQIAGQRYAHTKGMMIGYFAAALVMLIPPLMNALVDLANTVAGGSPDKAVKLGIMIGFMLVVALQALSMTAVAIWWDRRLGRPE